MILNSDPQPLSPVYQYIFKEAWDKIGRAMRNGELKVPRFEPGRLEPVQ